MAAQWISVLDGIYGGDGWNDARLSFEFRSSETLRGGTCCRRSYFGKSRWLRSRDRVFRRVRRERAESRAMQAGRIRGGGAADARDDRGAGRQRREGRME